MVNVLDELAAAEGAATKGPWMVHPEDLRGGRYWCVQDPEGHLNGELDLDEFCNGEANARFIALARTHLPALLAAADALCSVIDAWDDKVWGAMFAMRRAMPDARKALATLTQDTSKP